MRVTEYGKGRGDGTDMYAYILYVYTKAFHFLDHRTKQDFPFAQSYLTHVPAGYWVGDHQRIPAVDCFAFLTPHRSAYLN
jgi:hypothetical protein